MTSEKNPELVLAILRALADGEEIGKGSERYGLRYKELLGAVKDQIGSKETLQVYLDWLINKKIIKREQKSRKNVQYVVEAGIEDIIMDQLVLSVRGDVGASDNTAKELTRELTNHVVRMLSVAVAESLDPFVDAARKLGPEMVVKLVAESVRLAFEQTAHEVLNNKKGPEIAAQILEIASRLK